MINKLYEDYALEKINEKHFNRLFKVYDEEQTEKENLIKSYQEELDSYNKQKVVVHESKGSKRGKDRTQEVDIYFNFIGNINYEK